MSPKTAIRRIAARQGSALVGESETFAVTSRT